MKKFFAIAAMAVACLTAGAQQQEEGTFSIMPKIGLGYATLTHMYDFSNFEINSKAGAEVKYQCSEVFGVSLGLEYAYERSDKKIEAGNIKFHPQMTYLNVPVLAHFNIGDHFGVMAGVQPGFMLSHDDWGYVNDKEDYLSIPDECFKKTAISIPIGISWTFNEPVVVGLTYTFPVTKVNNYGDGNVMNHAVWLTCGYRIDL